MNRRQKLQVTLAVVRVKELVCRDGQRAWFAKEKISMLLKEVFGKAFNRGEQAEALPLEIWGVSHEPQPCLGKGTSGQQDNLSCRANALCRVWHLHKALERRGGLLPHFRKPLNKEGSRAFVGKGPCGWQSDQREVLLMHTADSQPSQPGKGLITLISTLLPELSYLLFVQIL